MLRNITIYKRTEVKTDKHPTHDIVAIDENYNKESKVIVGSLWTKVLDDGTRFLSGGLSKGRVHEGKSYDGYVIITEKEWNEYQGLKNKLPEVKVDLGEANLADVPF